MAVAVAEEAAAYPGVAVEVFCTDEHRFGLKPVLRSVWALKGQRPTALGHHRFQWLYFTAFVGSATGETVWYLTDTVSKPLFADLLDTFARAVGAGPNKRVVLLLDNAGWHTRPTLAVPDGITLVYLPPYSPELQPAETLWTSAFGRAGAKGRPFSPSQRACFLPPRPPHGVLRVTSAYGTTLQDVAPDAARAARSHHKGP